MGASSSVGYTCFPWPYFMTQFNACKRLPYGSSCMFSSDLEIAHKAHSALEQGHFHLKRERKNVQNITVDTLIRIWQFIVFLKLVSKIVVWKTKALRLLVDSHENNLDILTETFVPMPVPWKFWFSAQVQWYQNDTDQGDIKILSGASLAFSQVNSGIQAWLTISGLQASKVIPL